MTTKEKLLAVLDSHRSTYLSGEEIAAALNISRAAVWKAVNALRKDGYTVDAVNNKGYRLSPVTDILSPTGIQKYLREDYRGMNIHVEPSVRSTNAAVREQAALGEPEGYLLVANEQTEGKGRYGRTFFSPDGSGIYLSLLLRPQDCPAGEATHITTMAAVALCRAISEVTDAEPSIKWVNDVFVQGKKAAGILTEASVSLENGLLDAVILGIGLNVYPPENGFPPELAAVAGAVTDRPSDDLKNRLTAALVNHFMDLYTARFRAKTAASSDYMDDYRAYSFVIGRHVTVLKSGRPDEGRSAYVRGLDDDCRLLVTYDANGEEAVLSYGEISVKP